MSKKFEDIMAWHDGEQQTDTEAIKHRIDQEDAETQALLAKLREADDAFIADANALLDMPVPPALTAAIMQPEPKRGKVIQFPLMRSVLGFAVAAGLATVVATNLQIFSLSDSSSRITNSRSYLAQLQQVLEKTPSGELEVTADGAIAITPMMTVKTQAQQYCREFMAKIDSNEITGIACREPTEGWQIISQQIGGSHGMSDRYMAAEGGANNDLDSTIITNGDELTYTEEATAIDAGWSDSGRNRAGE